MGIYWYMQSHVERTHDGRHDKALVHEPISEVVAFEHQEVSIMGDLTSDFPEMEGGGEGEKRFYKCHKRFNCTLVAP